MASLGLVLLCLSLVASLSLSTRPAFSPLSPLSLSTQPLSRLTMMMSSGSSGGSVMVHGVEDRAAEMKAAAASETPFSEAELDSAVKSLQNVAGPYCHSVDWAAYRLLLSLSAHTTHKDWERTDREAQALSAILGTPSSPPFRHMFRRVLGDGNWDGAVRAAANREGAPWVVLVTGLNGIRKTSSVLQPWFRDCLHEALTLSEGAATLAASLPDGTSSFFRQLDYMIATLANEEFRTLYRVGEGEVAQYSALKDAIFSRYRKLAETLGVLLVREARTGGLGVFVETSGRDIAMYEYVNHCFGAKEGGAEKGGVEGGAEGAAEKGGVVGKVEGAEAYRRLVVHFEISHLSHAEASVDRRMRGEMAAGREALRALNAVPKTIPMSVTDTVTSVTDTSVTGASSEQAMVAQEAMEAVSGLVQANAGGPYGSSALRGVQADSDRVWARVRGGDGAARGWLRANLQVTVTTREVGAEGAEGGQALWTVSARPPSSSSSSSTSSSSPSSSAPTAPTQYEFLPLQ